MQTYKCVLIADTEQGRHFKVIDLPFVPQVGMTIFRSSALMWMETLDDSLKESPQISRVGYNLDEAQFEVEFKLAPTAKLTSAFWTILPEGRSI